MIDSLRQTFTIQVKEELKDFEVYSDFMTAAHQAYRSR